MKWKERGMVYMNSEFKSHLLYELKKNRRSLIMINALLFLLIPFYVYMSISTVRYQHGTIDEVLFQTLIEQCASCGFVIAFIASIFQFRFLYDKRMNDTYFSLPIKRSHLFCEQYVIGLILWFIPLIIQFLLGYLVAYLNRDMPTIEGPTLLIGLILLIVLIVQYTIVTFFNIKCHRILDAVFVNVAYLILPYFVIAVIATFVNYQAEVLFQIPGNVTFGFQNIIPLCLSLPMYFYKSIVAGIQVTIGMIEPVVIPNQYDFVLSTETKMILIYWIVLALIVFHFAKKSFIACKAECCEQQTTSKLTYPFIIRFITLLMIVFTLNTNQQNLLIPFIISLGFYFGTLFFAQRCIRIKRKDILLLMGICVFAYGIGWGYQITNGFGITPLYPSSEKVANATFILSGDIDSIYGEEHDENDPRRGQYTTEALDKIESIIHLQENLKHDNEHAFQNDVIAMFSYELKDGGSMLRYYTLDLNEQQKSLLLDFINTYEAEQSVE